MIKKVISSIVSVALVGTTTVGGTPLYAQQAEVRLALPFNLPSDLGVVQEYALPAVGTRAVPFIFHIQDAHAHPEAEKKIREIVRSLAPDLVAIEGAVGPLHPEYLDFLPEHPAANEAVIQDLASKGELSGAEQAAWEEYRKNQKGRFFGAENLELYRENLQAFRSLLFKRDEITTLLAPLRKEIEKAKSRILSPELRRFLQEKERRKEGNYGTGINSPELGSYVNYLTDEAKKTLRIDLRDPFEQLRFPHLVRVLVLAKLTESRDLEKAQAERDALFQRLDGKLVSQLKGVEKAKDPRGVAESLWRFAKQKNISLQNYPDYLRSLGVLILRREVDAEELFREMERLEAWIVEKLATREEEKRLVEIAGDFTRLERLLHLELTREEFNQVVEKKETLRPKELSKRLKGVSLGARSLRAPKGRSNPDFEIASSASPPRNDGPVLETFFVSAFAFYEGARKRDQVLFENTLELARKKGAQKVVLVTGGFHTEGLVDRLKSAGLGYVVIRPQMTGPAEEKLYYQVLRDEHADLSAYFKESNFTKQEALFLKELLEVASPVLFEKYRLSHSEVAKKVAEVVNAHPVLGERLRASASPYKDQSLLKLDAAKTPAGNEGRPKADRPLTAKTVADAALTGESYYFIRPPAGRVTARPAFVSLATGRVFSVRAASPVKLEGEGFEITSGPIEALEERVRSEAREESVQAPVVPKQPGQLSSAEMSWGGAGLIAAGVAVFLIAKAFLKSLSIERPVNFVALDELVNNFLLGNEKVKAAVREAESDGKTAPRVKAQVDWIKSVLKEPAVARVVVKLESEHLSRHAVEREAQEALSALNEGMRKDLETLFPRNGGDKNHRLYDLLVVAAVNIAASNKLNRAVGEEKVRMLYAMLRSLEFLSNYSDEKQKERDLVRSRLLSRRSEVRNGEWWYENEPRALQAVTLDDGGITPIEGVEKVEVAETLRRPDRPLGEIEKNPGLIYLYAKVAAKLQSWHALNRNWLVAELADADAQETLGRLFELLPGFDIRVLSSKGEGGISAHLPVGMIQKAEGVQTHRETDWFGDNDGARLQAAGLPGAVVFGAHLESHGAVSFPDTLRRKGGRHMREFYVWQLVVGPKAKDAQLKLDSNPHDFDPRKYLDENLEEIKRASGKTRVSDLRVGTLFRPRHRELIRKLSSVLEVKTRDFDEMEREVEKNGFFWNGNLLLLKDGDQMPTGLLYFVHSGELDLWIGAGAQAEALANARGARRFGGKFLGRLILEPGTSEEGLTRHGFFLGFAPNHEVAPNGIVYGVNEWLDPERRIRWSRVWTEEDLIRAKDGVFFAASVSPKGKVAENPLLLSPTRRDGAGRALPFLDDVVFEPETGRVSVSVYEATESGGVRILRVTLRTPVERLEKAIRNQKEILSDRTKVSQQGEARASLMRDAYLLSQVYADFQHFDKARGVMEGILPFVEAEDHRAFVEAVLHYLGALKALVSGEVTDPTDALEIKRVTDRANQEALSEIISANKRLPALEKLPQEVAGVIDLHSPKGIERLEKVLRVARGHSLLEGLREGLESGARLDDKRLAGFRREWDENMGRLRGLERHWLVEALANVLVEEIEDNVRQGVKLSEEPVVSLLRERQRIVSELPDLAFQRHQAGWANALLRLLRYGFNRGGRLGKEPVASIESAFWNTVKLLEGDFKLETLDNLARVLVTLERAGLGQGQLLTDESLWAIHVKWHETLDQLTMEHRKGASNLWRGVLAGVLFDKVVESSPEEKESAQGYVRQGREMIRRATQDLSATKYRWREIEDWREALTQALQEGLLRGLKRKEKPLAWLAEELEAVIREAGIEPGPARMVALESWAQALGRHIVGQLQLTRDPRWLKPTSTQLTEFHGIVGELSNAYKISVLQSWFDRLQELVRDSSGEEGVLGATSALYRDLLQEAKETWGELERLKQGKIRSEVRENIAVIGISDAGLATAAVLAAQGHRVTAVGEKGIIENIGEINHEPGLHDLIFQEMESGRLQFVERKPENIAKAIGDNTVIYLDAGNPEKYLYPYPEEAEKAERVEQGEKLKKPPKPTDYLVRLNNLAGFVGERLRKLRAEGDNRYRVFVLRGTIPIGTTENVLGTIKNKSQNDSNFGVAYQPDFLRKGKAIEDVKENQIVIGLPEIKHPWETSEEELKKNRNWEVLRGIVEPFRAKGVKVNVMNVRAAELSKIALLTFLGSKFGLLNALAPIVRVFGGDLNMVAHGMGLDPRVGVPFTNPSITVGGRLIVWLELVLKLYQERQSSRPVASGSNGDLRDPKELLQGWVQGILATNKGTVESAQHEIKSALLSPSKRPLEGATVSLLGVAAKPGTDHVVNSPAVELMKWLIEEGVTRIRVYDPAAEKSVWKWMERFKSEQPQFSGVALVMAKSPLEAIRGSQVAVYGSALEELKGISLEEIKGALGEGLLVDAINLYGRRADGSLVHSLEQVRQAKIDYVSVGRPPILRALAEDEKAGREPQLVDSRLYLPDDPLPIDSGKEGKKKRVTIFGAGYVGLVLAGVLSTKHSVQVLDIVKDKIRKLKKGKLPIYEQGADRLILRGMRTGNLRFDLGGKITSEDKEALRRGEIPNIRPTRAAREAVKTSDILYLAVPTPQKHSGEIDLRYIYSAALQIGTVLKEMNEEARRKDPKTLVIKSTVTPDTFPEIEKLLKSRFNLEAGKDYLLASNPEFLREGSAVHDSLHPDLTLIGTYASMPTEARERAARELLELWEFLVAREKHRKRDRHTVMVTDTATSTIIKYGKNSYLAMSVSMANLFAFLAEIEETYYEWVKRTFLNDPRIPEKTFLQEGCGYGGSCFPKDVRALDYLADHLIKRPILLTRLADSYNDLFKRRVVWELADNLVGAELSRGAEPLRGKTVGVAGITFKAGTDDVREASSVSVIRELVLMGANVKVYDPIFSRLGTPKRGSAYTNEAMRVISSFLEEFKKAFVRLQLGTEEESIAYFKNERIEFVETTEGIFRATDAVVVLNEWPEFRKLNFDSLVPLMRREGRKNPIVMDARGLYVPEVVNEASRVLGLKREGFFSPGVGRPALGDRLKLFDLEEAKKVVERNEPRSELRRVPTAGFKFIPERAETQVARAKARELVNGAGNKIQLSREKVEAIGGVARESSGMIYAVPVRLANKLRIPLEQAYRFIAGELTAEAGEVGVWSSKELDLLGRFGNLVKPGTLPASVIVRLTAKPELTETWLPLLKFLSANETLRLIVEIEGINDTQAEALRKELVEYGKHFGVFLRPQSLTFYGVQGAALHPDSYRRIVSGQEPVGLLSPHSEALHQHVRKLLRVQLSGRSEVRDVVAATIVTAARLQALPEDLTRVYTPEELAESSGFQLTSLLERLATVAHHLATQA